ncbi:MAG: ClbS/DfsB family four-helix bundle protein [Caldilineaceae bacterium]
MPRPTTKVELLRALDAERSQLESLLAPLAPEQLTAPGVVGAWSVKDVLAHLTAWHQMCLTWHAAGKRGEQPATPADGLTWQQIPILNERIYMQWRDEPLASVRTAFAASCDEIRAAIAAATDEELWTPKVYKWTKSTTLGAYFVSATSSHYLWARTEIRKGLKAKAA